MASLQDSVQFLTKHIPYTTPDRMQECVDELGVITDNLLLKERFLVLTSFLDMKKLPAFFPSKRDEFLAFISQPPKTTEFITAQQMHFICKLYEFFLHNPEKLVVATVEASKSHEKGSFAHFTNSVIPSVFGFFSCAEHIQYAYQFYTIIILQTKKDVIEKALQPFFVSTSTMKYVEGVYEDINMYFCHDIRLAGKNVPDSIIEQHAKTLIQSIENNLKLLPEQHLNLLTLLEQNGWSDAAIFEYFVKTSLIPQIKLMLTASHFSNHVNIFIKVALSAIKIFPKMTRKPVFMNNYSIFEVPEAFSNFNRHFMRFVTTTRDAVFLFELSKKVLELPNILIRLGETEKITDLFYRPIILKIYPKNMPPSTFSDGWRNVVFTDRCLPYNKYEIPMFDRHWRFLDINAATQNISVHEYCEENPNISARLLNESSPDLSGLCPQCTLKILEGEAPCKSCAEIIAKRSPVSFKEYMINREYESSYNQSQNFERMLKLKFALNELKAWIKSVDRMYDMTITSLSQAYINSFFIDNPPKQGAIIDFSPSTILSEISPVLNMPHVVAFFLAVRTSLLIGKWLTPENAALVNNLKKLWRKNMDCGLGVELPPCFSGVGISKTKRLLINQYYMRISLGLESIGLIPFSKRFMFLIKELEYMLKLVDILGTDHSLIVHSLQICSNNELIFTLLAIGATLGKSVDFLTALNSKERELWHTLENIVSKMVDRDAELKRQFYALHNSLFDFVQGTTI